MSWIVTEDRLIRKKEIAMLRLTKGQNEDDTVLIITLRSGTEVSVSGAPGKKIWDEFQSQATEPKKPVTRPWPK